MFDLKVLITGANGLLGRHAVEALRGSYEVHAIVRKIPEVIFEDVTYHVYDMTTEWNTDTLPDGIHTVFHLAQSELFREFPDHALDVYNVNVTSTVKLLDYARKTGVSKFVFASTGGIYDSSEHPLEESSPVNVFGSLGNYFATKLCSEILTHNYTKFLDIVLLRIFFMYGKGQKRSMLMPRLVDNILLGKPVTLTADGGVLINPIHVSDVVTVLEKLINLKGSFTFNVAGPQVLNLKQIAELIATRTGKRPEYQFSSEKGTNCIANIEHLQQLVYNPQAKLEDKIAELF